MHLSRLQAFVAAAQKKSFTKAAEKLYITQPTLTHRIQELERELGYPLFIRTGRSIELTEAGRQLLFHVEQAIKILDEGLSVANRSQRSARHLILACIPVFCLYYLPDLFSFIRSRGLPLDLTLKTCRSSEEVLRFMKDGGASIGIINENLVSLPRNYRTMTLLEDSICIVGSSDYPKDERDFLPLKDLQKIPMIAYDRERSFWKIIDGFFAKNKVKPNIIIEADNFAVVKSLLASPGGCISVLPRIAIKHELAIGTFVEIKTKPALVEKWKMGAICQTSKKLPESVEIFFETLKSFLVRGRET